MCTVVLSLDPAAPVPLLLLGVRDELFGRPWQPPARHWPGSPLVGGLDEQAGGTWLSVHPDIPRVACVLNGRGPLADPARRRSRGDLPLRAATEGPGFLKELADDLPAISAYDPFHLICATPDSVTELSWPASPPASASQPDRPALGRPAVRELAPGTHLLTNAGHAYPADPAHPDDPVTDPKAVHFAARFAAARPSADPALPLAQAWGDWLPLAQGDGLDPADPRAIIIRHVLPDGRAAGSTSVSLVGLAPDALRYDFQPYPGNPDGWYRVAVPLSRTSPLSRTRHEHTTAPGTGGRRAVTVSLSGGNATHRPQPCRYGDDMPKARSSRTRRTTALAAAGTALITAALAVPAAMAAAPAQAGPAALPRLLIKPGIIKLPGISRSGPSTTAQCEAVQQIACYQPDQIRAAYHLPALYAAGITGKGQTIVIVDSFGSPTIARDLATFDKQFHYPAPPKFQVIAPAGKIPRYNAGNGDMVGWAAETTLDVEYAHALAPGANILLVETPVSETEGTTGFPQIVKAEKYVIDHNLGTVISQSFGATEATFTGFAQLKPLRAAYLDAFAHHVTVLAASGDGGATDYRSDGASYYTRRVTSWPDSDPLVTSVGGTQLRLKNGAYTSVAWNDTYNAAWTGSSPSPAASGGGLSAFFTRPAWQAGVKAVTGSRRGVPDISMSAACNGAVNVYGSYGGQPPGWSLACGTSEATPEFAAVVALAAQLAGHRLGLINPRLYTLLAKHAPGLVDVTSGNNTVSFSQGPSGKLFTVKGYSTRPGYDLVTGVGTINAPALVHELAGK